MNAGLRKQNVWESNRWDDPDGYYLASVHENLGDRYIVTEINCGKGVYSSIVKAKDTTTFQPVAIKVVRANEVMKAAAEREVEILQMLQNAEGESKRHIVTMLSSFAYRGHLCIVFECLWDDCREALRRLTKGRGMTLNVVRSYAQQLALGLRHMHRCGVLHGDIKPDNILLNDSQSTVKFCDFGTATDLRDVEIGAYIVSRMYRAPEVVLGCLPTAAVDVFSLGCTLYELFSGKGLFRGKGNHDHLRKIMEVKGPMTPEVIERGEFWKRHFNDDFSFKSDKEADPRHAEPDAAPEPEVFPKLSLRTMVFERVGPERCKSTSPEDQKYVQRAERFSELLEALLDLDPSKRLTANDAIQHALFR